ncbi:hypothetical protein F511_10491 [Dorcoceras hygrometricum]|uniref:Uncharacterized protein n=1 Tax=Dorcoceras hygrometricum TaxID=472368 RepID=A0A2Z7CUZ9_9LAMI|nr:hypothetical protein F511_10491 [Dorcoceras hygrometricum]
MYRNAASRIDSWLTKSWVGENRVIDLVDVVPFEDVPNVIGNYDMCVVKDLRLTSDIIARARQMKLIMQFGVGLEGVDITAATTCGIKVARIPGDATGNATSCAEMAIYLMLGLLRKQVFIMGFGNIGVHLAKRLRPFSVKILATKRTWLSPSWNSGKSAASFNGYGTNDDLVDEKGDHGDILKFASQADIVGIVDKVFISSMKKVSFFTSTSLRFLFCKLYRNDMSTGDNLLMFQGALLINIARGRLFDYDAVLYHLQTGHLGGLGIDVAWSEPFDPDDAVLKFPNVIITPHVAGVTEYSYRSMAKIHAGRWRRGPSTPFGNLFDWDRICQLIDELETI